MRFLFLKQKRSLRISFYRHLCSSLPVNHGRIKEWNVSMRLLHQQTDLCAAKNDAFRTLSCQVICDLVEPL